MVSEFYSNFSTIFSIWVKTSETTLMDLSCDRFNSELWCN